MANGHVSAARPLALPPFILLLAAAILAVFGLVLAESPADGVLLLTAAVGLVVAFARPDWFVYFILFTIPIDFTRVYLHFPFAVEELYILAVPFIIFHWLAGGKIVRRLTLHSVYAWPALGLLLLVALSYFRATDRIDFIKDAGRFGGAVIVAWAVLNVATTWDRQRKMIYSFLGGALVISILIFCQIIVGGPTWFFFFVRGTTATQFSPTHVGEAALTAIAWSGRGLGLSGPSSSGMFLEELLALALYRVFVEQRKFWHYVMLSALWAGILLTFTTVPILSALAASALLILAMRKGGPRLALAVGIVAGVSFLIAEQAVVSRMIISRLHSVGDLEIYQRLRLWKMGLQLFERHPLVGVGYSNSAIYFIRGWGQFWQAQALSLMNHPHELYIYIADELGLLGLACYAWIWFRALGLGYRAYRDSSLGPRRFEVVALSCAIMAWLIQGFTDTATGGYECWALLGLIEATYYLVRADRKAALRAASRGMPTP